MSASKPAASSSTGATASPWAKTSTNQSQDQSESRDDGGRKKSLTLQAMGAKMLAEGRSHADLTLEDLKQLDPMSLPPKLRVKVQPSHPLYVRESSSYGAKAPNDLEKSTGQFATSQSFTKWHGGKYHANTALNTGVDKSRVHAAFDQF
mmetsp:Transcript_54425/g.80790  ORF Transcript_54425/g.80790 Transcript_54425/m.80790 type:complete len:149 (+) Transcript_54425:108-554(+)|eukprot:CAMPEP_0195518318 /NCGR_PEP_ID=MMETSP0794_2-20130614/12678_1 /TAXON_ID=515487 /ORGANISM="Stephanopyxis turris, Strain CCMP 815" /LENGTH=148 /DNA_ID=CAMNT_0040647261 /DNA_START=106 /DNA_END=552 /DNA_ORIENTATION=+